MSNSWVLSLSGEKIGIAGLPRLYYVCQSNKSPTSLTTILLVLCLLDSPGKMLNIEFKGSRINVLCEDTNKEMDEVRKSIQDLGREASNIHVEVRNEDQECG